MFSLNPNDLENLGRKLSHLSVPFNVYDNNGSLSVDSTEGKCVAQLPAVMPESLGDPSWLADHHTKYAYYGGEMAQGIASAAICEELAKAGMIGYFGAGGLSPEEVEKNIVRLNDNLTSKGLPFGSNLINSPQDPSIETRIVNLYLQHNVTHIGAAAYLQISLPLVKYRLKGLSVLPNGEIETKNHVAAKISRNETAIKFLSPAPSEFVAELLAQGEITEEQAKLAERVPVSDDITAEADSGGHTDNRAAMALFPSIVALRDQQQDIYHYAKIPRVGLGGGISTPYAAAGAFAMGADYIVVGSAHQACVESGTSDVVREMLSHATQADVAMAPAGDMFEMGAKVQVLKWGTLFSQRAKKLADWYTQYKSMDQLPPAAIKQLERDYFRKSLTDVWNSTVEFFKKRDPAEIAHAEADPHHKMALIFRAYLGQSSHWAILGDPSNKTNFQIWSGPALGAFNEWTKGSFMESPANRHVATVAKNILYGAAFLNRVNMLAVQKIRDPRLFTFTPKTDAELDAMIN